MQLSIEKLVYGGDGLAHLPADEQGRGKAVFLPFVLEGEDVEATIVEDKRSFARARAGQVLGPSPHRIQPSCPYFARCGGCHYQHADYRHQLEIKLAVFKENLRRIAKLELEADVIVHPSPEWNYRNRARLKVQTKPQFAIGYYRYGSHELLPIEQCPISSPLINRAIAKMWELGGEGKISQEVRETEFFADAEDEQLLVTVSCTAQLSRIVARELAEDLRKLVPHAIGVLLLPWAGEEQGSDGQRLASAGGGELAYRTKSDSYRVSGGSFFQVNRYLVDDLVEIVSGQCSGGTVLDLYAGVGLFSKVLARSFAQVIAVESSPTAYADLVYNASSNVQAVHATTNQFLQKQRTGTVRADLVVVDPPRGGLGGMVVRSLAGLGVEQITYVSCDPATLSRDLAGLLAAGYRVRQAHVVDLFPQTFHIESVVHLAR